MILNKIPNNWYKFPDYFIEAVANGAHEDELKHLLDYRTLTEISKYRWGNIPDFGKYVEYNIFEECLQHWQFMFNYDNADYDYWFDGYSQVKHSFTCEYDYQGFENEHYIVVMVADVYCGLGVLINKHTYEITLFDIAEDDGHWFVGNSYHLHKDFNYLKTFLMSQIAEIHSDNFYHQLVIEKLWNKTVDDIQNIYFW